LLSQTALIDTGRAHDITPSVLAEMDQKLIQIQVGLSQTAPAQQ